MKIVRIPPTLRSETGGKREVHAAGGTVRELLDDTASTLGGWLDGQALGQQKIPGVTGRHFNHVADAADVLDAFI